MRNVIVGLSKKTDDLENRSREKTKTNYSAIRKSVRETVNGLEQFLNGVVSAMALQLKAPGVERLRID